MFELKILLIYGDHCAMNLDKFHTPQKMKFAIKDFFSKCDQIRRKLRIWSQLLKNYLMGNFIFCAVIPSKDARHRMRKTINMTPFPSTVQFFREHLQQK